MSRKILSVEELETVPAGTVPRTPHQPVAWKERSVDGGSA